MSEFEISPEERKEVEAEQKRLYQEYKKESRFQKKLELGNLNPYLFSEELLKSIPDEELKELYLIKNKKPPPTIRTRLIQGIIWIIFILYLLSDYNH